MLNGNINRGRVSLVKTKSLSIASFGVFFRVALLFQPSLIVMLLSRFFFLFSAIKRPAFFFFVRGSHGGYLCIRE